MYAVDASDMADQAQEVFSKNGFSDRIHVIHTKIELALLPEQVDIIVSEVNFFHVFLLTT